jgi:hypothetical protein
MRVLLFLFTLFVNLSLYAQLDEFDIGPGIAVSSNPISTFYHSNTTEISTIRGSWVLDVDPNYESNDKLVIASNILFIGFMHIPILNKENWSVGNNTSLGVGVFKAFNGFDEKVSLSIELETSVFYKNKNILNGLEFLLGYKFNYTWLPYKLPIIGIKKDFIQVYASLYRDKYYLYLSNMDYVPTAKIAEVGVKLFF